MGLWISLVQKHYMNSDAPKFSNPIFLMHFIELHGDSESEVHRCCGDSTGSDVGAWPLQGVGL